MRMPMASQHSFWQPRHGSEERLSSGFTILHGALHVCHRLVELLSWNCENIGSKAVEFVVVYDKDLNIEYV